MSFHVITDAPLLLKLINCRSECVSVFHHLFSLFDIFLFSFVSPQTQTFAFQDF